MTRTLNRRRFLVGASAAGLAALQPRFSASAQDPGLRIAASMPLLADIVRHVAGSRAEVFPVIPESADPHTWEARPQDIVAATGADTFISIGAHLEPFVETGGWRRAVRDAGIPELEVAGHLDLVVVDRVIDHGDHVHDLREGDPHFWLDPRMVIDAIPVIRDHLSSIDPEGGMDYASNSDTYIVELTALDAELATDLATIPEERRKLVVFHDAYTYFAARFDFDVVGIVLKNPNTEVSAQELAELHATIDEMDIDVIFTEPQFNDSMLDALEDQAGVSIGELLTDSFAGRTDSYTGLMRYNRDSLVTHLRS